MATLNLTKSKRNGFTLIDVLLAIALFVVIIGIVGPPVFRGFQNRNDLDSAALTVVQAIRRAEQLSRANFGDAGQSKNWGIRLSGHELTIFQGDSFAARNASFDEVFMLPETLTLSGLSEIVFSKFSGEPNSTGTITLTSETSETINLTVNEKGIIGY